MFGRCMRVLGSAALGMALLIYSSGNLFAQQGQNGPWLGGGNRSYSNPVTGYAPVYTAPANAEASTGGQFSFPQGMSGYFSPSDSTNNRAILVNLHVPANAAVWFDGNSTKQMGDWRSYMSPPTDSDKTMHYDVRARWTDANGQMVDQTRRVAVHAGQRTLVDFLTSAAPQQDSTERLIANPKATEAKPK